MHVSVEKDVASILQKYGVDLEEINSVIFSHHHFDHTGDIRRVGQKTKVIVGAGYKKQYLPGWPDNKRKWETTSDLYRNREVVEISFSASDERVLEIGGFQAYDYFGDGSFNLLNTPGHTVGHLSALARTTSSEVGEQATFVLLGGDIAHNCALFRPSNRYTLPNEIDLEAESGGTSTKRARDVYARLHHEYSEADGGRRAMRTPFCTATGPHYDVEAAQRSIGMLATFDEMENVFTMLAHETSLEGVVDLFPASAADWRKEGWKERCQWRFLGGLLGKEEGRRTERSRL